MKLIMVTAATGVLIRLPPPLAVLASRLAATSRSGAAALPMPVVAVSFMLGALR